MLADRGSCSFAEKVRNMEDAGAAVGIVIDNTEEDVSNVIMTDDGGAGGIRMPSILIGKSDGRKIVDFMKTASQTELDQLAVMISFDIGRPDNRVEYDIWYSSTHNRALDFITDFQHLDDLFYDDVKMTPHMRFWSCEECEESFKKKNCFVGGKYCAYDTNHPTLTGREIILEDLRQLCIYDSGQFISGGYQNTWWEYVKRVHEECYGNVNDDCSKIAHKDMGIDYEWTEKCVKKSFSGSSSTKINFSGEGKDYEKGMVNKIIDKEIQYYEDFGPNTFPAIVINN